MVFIDFDGLIANFSKSACQRLGIKYPSNTLFEDYGWLGTDHDTLIENIKGHDFWVNIEAYPWSNKLVDSVDKISNGNWIFLTHAVNDPGCYSGKYSWYKKHFSRYDKKLCVTDVPKHKFCHDCCDFLIDDKPQNIDEWRSAGGTAFYWQEISDDYSEKIVTKRIVEIVKTIDNINKTT